MSESTTFRLPKNDVMSMFEDPAPTVQSAAFALFARLSPPDIETALPHVVSLVARRTSGNDAQDTYRLSDCIAQIGKGAYRPLLDIVTTDPDPMIINAGILALQAVFAVHDETERAERATVVSAQDMQRLEGLLEHSHDGVRLAGASLLSLAPFSTRVVNAPRILSLWITDQSQAIDWYKTAREALVKFGDASLAHIIRCLSRPEEVIADAKITRVIDRLPEMVRDRAGDIAKRIGAAASSTAPALLDAIRTAALEKSKTALGSLQHLCRTFKAIKPGPGLGATVRELLKLIHDKSSAEDLSTYFLSYPVEGVAEIMALFDAGEADFALDALVSIAVESPELLRPYANKLGLILENSEPALYLRAAAVFAGLGRKASEYYSAVLVRLQTLIDEARVESEAPDGNTVALGYLLQLQDAIVRDKPQIAPKARAMVQLPHAMRRAA